MRLNNDFLIREVAGENILIATGNASQDFNGLITINEVAKFILENIDACENEDDLIRKITEEFDIDEETARNDAREYIYQALSVGIILEG